MRFALGPGPKWDETYMVALGPYMGSVNEVAMSTEHTVCAKECQPGDAVTLPRPNSGQRFRARKCLTAFRQELSEAFRDFFA